MIVEVVGAVIRDAAGRLLIDPAASPDVPIAPLLIGQIFPSLDGEGQTAERSG
jgi:hypothetical protein